MTVVDNVRELPVSRGGAFDLTYTDDGVIPLTLGDRVFPFFGKSYNQIYLSSNGYILFADLESLFGISTLTSTLDMPTLAAHFALPRISFLFTDLAPHISGEVWAKELDDRLAITLESVAVKPPADSYILNPDRVTVQLELFDDGQIRITYLSAVIPSGIVGLSDGRGVPDEPSTVYGGILDGFRWDFSELAPAGPMAEPVGTRSFRPARPSRSTSLRNCPRRTRCPRLLRRMGWSGRCRLPIMGRDGQFIGKPLLKTPASTRSAWLAS